jgi:response regulator RpfG family c-di-GMP phosphodiesterase
MSANEYLPFLHESVDTNRHRYQAMDAVAAFPGRAIGSQGQRGPLDPSELLVSSHTLLAVGASEYRTGRPREALEPLRSACSHLAELGNDDSLLRALLLCGRAERDLGLSEDASRRFGEALELARRLDDQGAEVEVLNLQAGLLSSSGDRAGSLELLEQALEIARDAGLVESQLNILNNLGSLRRLFGDYARALDDLQAAGDLIARTDVTSRSEAVNLINLGHLYRDAGDGQAAQESYARAREAGRKLDDQMVEVVSLNSLANVLARTGDWSSARELFHEALAMARRLGFSKYEVDNLDGLGQAHSALGESERATRAHREALLVARKISDPEGELDALLSLGRGYVATGDTANAMPYLIEAFDKARSLDRADPLIEAHELLGKAYEQKGDLARALRHQREAHALERGALNQTCEQRSRQLARLFAAERARREAHSRRLEELRAEAGSILQERSAELQRAQTEIALRLAEAAEYRDDETGEHTRRVGSSAAAIALTLGWSDEDVELISLAARLHDIGKIGVRDSILLKPGELTSEELDRLRTHTTIGASILAGGKSPLLRMAEEIALAHHERWDGNGYPKGMAAEEIPLSARIVAVADAFDALVHERPYKQAWSTEEALDEIRRQSGRQFDPRVVAAFCETLGATHEVQQPVPAVKRATASSPN